MAFAWPERYSRVKKQASINIPNVLDELNKTLTLEWNCIDESHNIKNEIKGI